MYKKDWKTAWATTFLRRKRNTFFLKNLNIHLMSHAYQIYIMGKKRIRFENYYLVNTIKLKLNTNDNNNEIDISIIELYQKMDR